MPLSPATASSVADNSVLPPLATAASKVPELKDIVSQTLLSSINAVKSGAAWIQGQIPDILTQFLHWQLAKNIITLGLWIIFGVILTLALKSKWIKTCHEDSEGVSTLLIGVVFGVLSIYGVFTVIDAIMNIVQISIAPKVYLLEYAAQLVKNNT